MLLQLDILKVVRLAFVKRPFFIYLEQDCDFVVRKKVSAIPMAESGYNQSKLTENSNS